ncbi:MAG: DnaD domain protein [Acholeplasmataceae bacterium]|nr:DnaD domain protein [Acholeplasmataceae bacterium]
MILKRLFEDYDLAIERILVKESKRLKLTMQEMSVLLALFSIYKKRRTFTMASLSKRVELSNEEIGASIETLINKNFLIISLENKDGKEREVFSLDQVFLKIEALYKADEIERIRNEELSYISQTIHLFEQGLGRSLLPYELENVRRWYEDKTYTHDDIIKAIKSAQDKVSIKYVERILNQIIPDQIEIDSDVEKALDEVFKNIR